MLLPGVPERPYMLQVANGTVRPLGRECLIRPFGLALEPKPWLTRGQTPRRAQVHPMESVGQESKAFRRGSNPFVRWTLPG